MSKTNSQPTLSQYFGGEDQEKTDDDVPLVTEKMSNVQIMDGLDEETRKLSKSEPEVCRMFTAALPQPRDPSAAFFDLIGSPTTSGGTSDAGIVTDFTLPNSDVSNTVAATFFRNTNKTLCFRTDITQESLWGLKQNGEGTRGFPAKKPGSV